MLEFLKLSKVYERILVYFPCLNHIFSKRLLYIFCVFHKMFEAIKNYYGFRKIYHIYMIL